MDIAGELLRVIVGDVLSHQNGSHGAQENGIAAEESKEFRGRCEDFPLW